MSSELDKAGVRAAKVAIYGRHERGFIMEPLIYPLDIEAAIRAYLDAVSPSRVDGDDISAPVFAGTPLVKLKGLLSMGWQISGYAIFKDNQHGLVTDGGLVAWWSVAHDNSEKAEARALAAETSLAEALRQRDELVEGLRALHDAIMDGLCNGGTPAYDKDAPERLDNAITTASRLILAASPQTPLGAESGREDE